MSSSHLPEGHEPMLPRALNWMLLITGANAIGCVLSYELGFGPSTFLFGPADRFADLIKVGLSYRAMVAPYLTDAKLAAWPEIFRSYWLANPYAQTLRPGLDQITNLHLTPLGQVVSMAAGVMSAVLPSPVWTLAVFFVVYVAMALGAVVGALPPRDREAPVIGAVALVLLLSYPGLFLLLRANFLSGMTSVGVIAFCLSLYRRGSVSPWALLGLAVAVNVRPNAAIFAFAIPLMLGVRASVPHLVRLAVASIVLALAFFWIATGLNPEYRLGGFLSGLQAYGKLYVMGSAGDAFNSSLLALLKTVAGSLNTGGLVLAIFDVLALALVALAWIGARAGRLRGSAVCFLLTACYALCTPVFGDYHLLVFLAPLLLLHLESRSEPVRWDEAARAVVVASVLLLSAKNLGTWHGRSIQTVLNPLITVGALLIVVRQALGHGPRERVS